MRMRSKCRNSDNERSRIHRMVLDCRMGTPGFGYMLVGCCIADSVDWHAVARHTIAIVRDTGKGMGSTIEPRGTCLMMEVEVQDGCSSVHSLLAQATRIQDSKIVIVAEGSPAARTMGMVAGLAPRPSSRRGA